ncbi:MAG: hypothetical protein IT232_07915 [Flavobacteriales bacterium]|nr:hypothetical protein [Flavobacteriales bacterium]
MGLRSIDKLVGKDLTDRATNNGGQNALLVTWAKIKWAEVLNETSLLFNYFYGGGQ